MLKLKYLLLILVIFSLENDLGAKAQTKESVDSFIQQTRISIFSDGFYEDINSYKKIEEKILQFAIQGSEFDYFIKCNKSFHLIHKNKYLEGIKLLEEVYNYANAAKNNELLILSSLHFALYYEKKGNLDKCLIKLKDAEKLLELNANTKLIPIYSVRAASYYRITNQNAIAKKIINNGYKIAIEESYFNEIGELAMLKAFIGNFPDISQKIKLINITIQSHKKSNHLSSVGFQYLNLATIYLKQNDEKKFSLYVDSASSLQDTIKLLDFQGSVVGLKARYFEQKNELDSAIKYLKLKSEFEHLYNQNIYQKEIAELEVKYEAGLKTSEIREKNSQISKTTFRLYLISSILFGFLLAGIILYYHFNKSKIYSRKIKIQSDELDLALKTKEGLITEIHHRVKNNLQVLSGLLDIQSFKSDQILFKNAVQESKQQIESMALVHQMLYNKEYISNVNINDYLKELTKSLLISRGANNIFTTINENNNFLPTEYAIPLGLITTELITNSTKHAFNNSKEHKIDIKFNLLKNEIFRYEYQDNGKGIDYEIKINEINTHGLKLVKMFCDEMDGSLTINTKNGFYIIIDFELKK